MKVRPDWKLINKHNHHTISLVGNNSYNTKNISLKSKEMKTGTIFFTFFSMTDSFTMHAEIIDSST